MNAGVHCAYCDAHLPKGPSRKTECRHCGQPIFIELSPSDRSRRVMTTAQAEVAETPCQACHDHQQDLRTLGAVDLAERELEREKSKLVAPSGEALARQQLLERIAQRSADPYERKIAALQAAWGAALAGEDLLALPVPSSLGTARRNRRPCRACCCAPCSDRREWAGGALLCRVWAD